MLYNPFFKDLSSCNLHSFIVELEIKSFSSVILNALLDTFKIYNAGKLLGWVNRFVSLNVNRDVKIEPANQIKFFKTSRRINLVKSNS